MGKFILRIFLMSITHDVVNNTSHDHATGSVHDAIDWTTTSMAGTKRVLFWGVNSFDLRSRRVIEAQAAIEECFPGVAFDFANQIKPTSDVYAMIIQDNPGSNFNTLPWYPDLTTGIWNGYATNILGSFHAPHWGYERVNPFVRSVNVQGLNPPPPPDVIDPQGILRVVEFKKSGCSPILAGFPLKLRMEYRLPTGREHSPVPSQRIGPLYTIIPGSEAIPLWSITSGQIVHTPFAIDPAVPLPLIFEVLGRKGKTRVYDARVGESEVGGAGGQGGIPYMYTEDIFTTLQLDPINPLNHNWLAGNGNWNRAGVDEDPRFAPRRSTRQMWRSMYAEICAEVT